MSGYDIAYLNKLSEYTNLQFEYVDCGTWANALTMLQNHEVDLVGTAQWSEEREQQYTFCLDSYGYTIAELAALPDREFVYEDYEAIGNAVIGCIDNYIRRQEMDQLFRDHDISPTIKTYVTQRKLEDALISGEIDIIAANSHTLLDSWDVIERFNYMPYYFISWSGNTRLTDALDLGILKIQLYENSFTNSLIRKYQPSLISVPLSKSEIDCLNQNKVYTIYLDQSVKPIAWMDENQQMKGTQAFNLSFDRRQRRQLKSHILIQKYPIAPYCTKIL